MKRKFWGFALILSLLGLFLVGCQLKEPTLVGTWRAVKYLYYQNGELINEIEFPHLAGGDCSYLPYIQFNEEQAKFISKVEAAGKTMIYPEDVFAYKLSENKMVMTSKDKSDVKNYTYLVKEDLFTIIAESLVVGSESGEEMVLKTEMMYIRKDDSEIANITIKPGSLGYR